MPNIEILKKVEIFKGLEYEDLLKIGGICMEQAYPEYQVIFEEDSVSDEMCILVEGKVEIKLKLPGKDKWVTLTKIDPGDVFGEFTLFDKSPRSASAVAFTEVVLYSVSRNDFFKLMEENPGIGYVVMNNFVQLLINRLRSTDSELRNHIIWELVEAGEDI